MTNIQENSLSMIVGTIIFLDKNAAITALLPGFGPLFTQFKVNKDEILVLKEQHEITKSGISNRKELLRADLVAKAYDISKKTEVYAKLVENVILAREVHFPISSLSKASDSKLEDQALIIHGKANANIDALAIYGITPEDLTALKSAIDLFHLAIPTPRMGTTDKKQITDQLAKLFKVNDGILAKIDLLVEIVRLSQPVFYGGYKDCRKIINTGSGSLAMIATVLDAETGEGIKGVKFTIARQDASGDEKPITKITAKTGKLNIKSLADNTYSTVVAKTGYKQKELTISKAAGDQVKIVVKLEKS